MSTQTKLCFKRLTQLITNDVYLHRKTILTVAATIIVLYALMPFQITANATAYFLILYLGGFIITSYTFKELHDKNKVYLYLTLPCSNLERFLSKWLQTTVLFAIGTLIVFYLFSLLTVIVNRLVYKQDIATFNLLQADLWLSIGKYIILQAIFLLGAVTFKKNAFIKTVLTLGCFLILISTVILLLAWSFCPNCSQGIYFVHTIFNGSYFLFWTILAPICWYLSYLRLTNYELT